MSCSSRAFEFFFFYSQCLIDACVAVLFRMGTTAKNAGSQENFTKIDKEYVFLRGSSIFSYSPFGTTRYTFGFI